MPKQSAKQAGGDSSASSAASAKVLGANLSALMKDHKELNSNPTVAKKTGMSASTIHRMRHGQVDATLRTLEKLADAFKVQPWELLVPTFDPRNRPALQPVSEQERRLYERLREVAKEIKEG